MADSWYRAQRASLLVLLVFCVGGCDAGESVTFVESSTEVQAPSPVAASSQAPLSGTSTAELWSRSCALCHVDGTAFAPRIGNASEWGPRLAQGRDLLLQHTLEGYGQMPPLGYCMACERDDFLALIDFMTAGVPIESKPSAHADSAEAAQ